jgi:hypothetical protein
MEDTDAIFLSGDEKEKFWTFYSLPYDIGQTRRFHPILHVSRWSIMPSRKEG